LRIFEMFSQFLFVLELSNAKSNIKKILFISTLFSIIFETLKVSTPQYLTSILASTLAIALIRFIFKINWLKSIVSYL